jgi:hypothetical protein
MIGNIAAGLYGTGVAPVTSSYFSIATTTLGSSQSSVTFTDGGAWADYKHLQVRALVQSANSGTASDVLNMDINGNSQTKNHYLYGNGSVALSGVGTAGAILNIPQANVTSVFSGVVIDILDFASTSKNKTIRALGGYDKNGAGELTFYSNLYAVNTNAITSITFNVLSTSIAQYSSFALYGIKD